MLVFWISCIVLLGIAALAFVIPLLRNRELTGSSRDQLNKDLYKNRITELKQDEARGVLDQSSDFIDEMQRGLLDDVVDEKIVASKFNSPLLWLVGVVFLVVFSVGMYMQLGAQAKVAHWQDIYARLPELTQRVMNQSDEVSDEEIAEFKLALTTKMKAEPDNAFGWLLLGRLNVAMGDANSALIAMDRAYKLAPADTSVVTGYTQALMLSEDPEQVAKAKRILAGLQQHKPNDIEVMSTSAFMALENEDFEGAIEQWQRMLPLLAGQPDRIEMIQGSIAYARKQIAAQGGASAPATSAAEAPVTAPAAQSQPTLPVQGAPELLTVTIAGEGQQQGYLFVYVQSVEGSKAPLAVKRIVNPILPLTLSLSDADAMMEQMKMSLFSSLKVSAKLSQDGSVTTPDDDKISNEVIVNEGDSRQVILTIAP